MEAVRTGNISLFLLSLYDYFDASLQFWLNRYVKILSDWLKSAADLYGLICSEELDGGCS
jgi:hypothetical protein